MDSCDGDLVKSVVTPVFVVFVSLLGGVDWSQDATTPSLSATAPPFAPPPPPKNAAHMLALALAESAQHVSLQSHSSGPCTPQSPPSSQDASSHFQDPPQRLFEAFTEEDSVTGGPSSPPNDSTSAVTPVSSCPITSSPSIKEQPLDLTPEVVKLPDDPVCSTQTDPDSALSDPSQCPGSSSLASPTRKVPEQQQSFTGQIPVQTSSSSHTPASNPSGSCRDGEVSSQPQVRLSPLRSAEVEYE